jgi:hypothetical protein
MRVLNEETASFFTIKLSQRIPIYSLQLHSSANDNSKLTDDTHFTSSNEDRIIITEVPMLMPNDLLQLPTGRAYCLIEGGQLWKVRMPLARDG